MNFYRKNFSTEMSFFFIKIYIYNLQMRGSGWAGEAVRQARQDPDGAEEGVRGTGEVQVRDR